MSACVNKVSLLGNLGKDPEVREIHSGKVVSFSLATSDSWTDKEGERQERTEWHRIVVYNGLGEVAERFLKKGSRVYLEGQLQTRRWTDVKRHVVLRVNTTRSSTSPFRKEDDSILLFDHRDHSLVPTKVLPCGARSRGP